MITPSSDASSSHTVAARATRTTSDISVPVKEDAQVGISFSLFHKHNEMMSSLVNPYNVVLL